MRQQIIALAVATIMIPTLVLAADGNTTPATTTTEQVIYVAHNDHESDRDHHDGRKGRSMIQYNGPVDLTPLASLKEIRWGDKDVIVEGRLIRQLANGDFILSDGKDEIVVELDDDLKLSDAIDQNTKVRIFGEYEGWDKKLEAEYIQMVK